MRVLSWRNVVHNAIQYYGGVLHVSLTASLIESVKYLSRRRIMALELKRNEEDQQVKGKRVAELDCELNNIETQNSITREKQCELYNRATVFKNLKTSL